MAVVVEPASHAGQRAHARRGPRPVVVLRWVAGLATIGGMALALYFGVAPIRITVHDQVSVMQASGEQGTGLTETGQTRAGTDTVKCVPYLQFDSSSSQHPACEARVHGRL